VTSTDVVSATESVCMLLRQGSPSSFDVKRRGKSAAGAPKVRLRQPVAERFLGAADTAVVGETVEDTANEPTAEMENCDDLALAAWRFNEVPAVLALACGVRTRGIRASLR
jgi:hypothetical protein